MRNSKLISIVLSIILLCSICGSALAEYIIFASPSFKIYTVSLSSAGSASFYATTTTTSASLKVSSCTLQTKSGSSWSDSKTLSTPAGKTNTNLLRVSKDYSSSMSSGNTYRIKAVFNADGNTVTAYSGEIAY